MAMRIRRRRGPARRQEIAANAACDGSLSRRGARTGAGRETSAVSPPGAADFSELAQPDVAVAHEVVMVLQAKRHVAMRAVARRADVGRSALERHVVLHEHA